MKAITKKLPVLLSLSFQIACFSEVRATRQTMAALSRTLRHQNCDSVWSDSPEPSPTFACNPGGVCLIVRSPWTVARLKPVLLARWIRDARAVVGLSQGRMTELLLWGESMDFRLGTVVRGENERLLRDAFAFAADMRFPTIVLGDFNDSPSSSRTMALADRFPMFRSSPKLATTATYAGVASKKSPLDHVYVNKPALELSPSTEILYSISLSDHFPLVCSLVLPISRSFDVIQWPKPVRDLVLHTVPPFPPLVQYSFKGWQDGAAQWLQEATLTSILKKGVFKVVAWSPPNMRRDITFLRLLSLDGLCREIQNFGCDLNKARSLMRKLHALGHKGPPSQSRPRVSC